MTVFAYAGAQIELPDEATPDQIKTALANFRQTPDFMALVDQKSGAPASVRMRVGNANDQDRLATLQQYYPDAIPHGSDNFIFTDPQTKRPTLYNPAGMDLGDVASEGKSITMGVASTLGAAAGVGSGLLTGPGAPLTVPQAAVAGAGLGNAAGAALWDLVERLSGPPVIDSRTAGERMVAPVVDVATGAIGQRVGDMAAAGIKAAVAGAPGQAERLVAAFNRLGVTPRASAVGSRNLANAEKMLESTPVGSDVIHAAAEQTATELKTAADSIATQMGTPLTEQGAGGVLKSAAKAWGTRFGEQQESAYETAWNLIGADAPVIMSNTRSLLHEMEAELSSAPRSKAEALKGAITKMQAIMGDSAERTAVTARPDILDPTGRAVITQADVLRPEGLPFGDLRQVRTMIGRDLASPMLAGSTSAQNDAMKRVYAAMTLDMSAAASAAGPEAAKALTVADRYTRIYMGQVAETMEKIAAYQADEGAYGYAMEGSEHGGSMLARLRRNFSPEEWDSVASTTFARLGKARPNAQDPTGETFSLDTFLTRWNTLSPEAKEALFGGTRYADLRPAMDDLLTVIGALKDANRLTNYSNTGRIMGSLALYGAMGASLGDPAAMAKVGITAVGGRAAAKLITSPAFVRWLASPVPEAGGWTAHLSRLAAIGAAEPEIKDEIHQYIMAMRDGPAPQQQQQR